MTLFNGLELVGQELLPCIQGPATADGVLNYSIPKSSWRNMDASLTSELDKIFEISRHFVTDVGGLFGVVDSGDKKQLQHFLLGDRRRLGQCSGSQGRESLILLPATLFDHGLVKKATLLSITLVRLIFFFFWAHVIGHFLLLLLLMHKQDVAKRRKLGRVDAFNSKGSLD